MYTIDIVIEAFSLYHNNNSFKLTSKILQQKYNYKITRQTIMNWIKLIQNNNNKFCNKRMTADYYKSIILSKQKTFKIDIMNDILKIINIDPFVTRNEIKIAINEKHNIKLSDINLSSIFKKLNLTRKKPRQYIVKSIEFLDKIIKKRNIFKNTITSDNFDINKIISIDESGFNTLKVLNKGLSQKGKRINEPVNVKRIKNKSLICSLTTTGIIHNEIHETGVNSIIFTEFIKNTISKLTELNYYFIFDNVSFHRNKEMLKLIIDSGHHYMFVPPYSPNNNPIEIVFGSIKNNFKKAYKEKDKNNKNICIIPLIKNAIEMFTKSYNKEKITKIFNYSLKYNYNNLEKELKDRLIIKNTIIM